ncbi:MAG: hypothetical protein AAGI09_02740 [Pseudomonadota bacterium]
MMRRLSIPDAVELMLDGSSDTERVEVAMTAALTTRSFAAVKPLREAVLVLERQAGDLEDAHYRHLATVNRTREIPSEAMVASPHARHLASEAVTAPVSGAFSNTPAGEPLTAIEPDGGQATRSAILPPGTSSRWASSWSRFLAWTYRVDRTWAGAATSMIGLLALAFLLTLIFGALT